jgi:hypothetical protein
MPASYHTDYIFDHTQVNIQLERTLTGHRTTSVPRERQPAADVTASVTTSATSSNAQSVSTGTCYGTRFPRDLLRHVFTLKLSVRVKA